MRTLPGMRIRAGRPADAEALRDIERAAGELFRPLGMDAVADDTPPTAELLAQYAQLGQLWVAADDPEGRPLGYLLVEPLADSHHIEQVTVHPRHAGRRIGRALIEHTAQQAAAAGVPALTLTAFAEVPWNAPYYRRCGFRVLDGPELPHALREIRAREAAAGLDRWPRVCMRRDLTGCGQPG